MKPAEVEKLLGGYATGTLSAEERQALFSAAVDNQQLFDALADEEALRELLADPAFRRQLRDSLASRPASFWESALAWMRRPLPAALAGGVAMVAIAIMIVSRPEAPKPAEQQIAKVISTPEAAAAVPEQPLQEAPRQRAIKKKEAVAAAQAPPPAERELRQSLADVQVQTQTQVQSQTGIAAEQVRASPAVGGRVANVPSSATYAAAIPVRWRIERLDAGGTYAVADPESGFRAGAEIRLAVDPLQAGQLAVLLREADGGSRSLFSGPVQPGARYLIPPSGSLSSGSGERTLVLVFSPGPALGKAAYRFEALRDDESARRSRTEQDKAKQAKTQDALALSEFAPGQPVTVEIPLRFQ